MGEQSAIAQAQVGALASAPRMGMVTLASVEVGGSGSCSQYGCVRFTPRNGCQCNRRCADFGNCCSDYRATCASTGKPATGSSKVLTLYHQTSPEICSQILSTSFKPGTSGWCGGGIYFAPPAEATTRKAVGPHSHLGCVIQAQVDVGRVKGMSSTCDRS